MRRIQFFEWEDQPWLPSSIRDAITDFLQFAVLRGDLYRGFAPRLALALQRSQAHHIVDLCSGAGGPLLSLARHIAPLRSGAIQVHLTDYYPNLAAWGAISRAAPHGFSYAPEPISALAVPPTLRGFRTLFSAFHHFKPADARQILQDAVTQRQGIAIAESTQRHPLLLAYMLLTPLLVCLSAPWQQPFRWSRLLWTYVLPVVPLAVAFDGIVSCLRTYTPAELLALVASTPGHESYDWQAGLERIGRLPVGVTYLIGIPRQP